MPPSSVTDTDSPTAQRRKREIAEAARAELLEKGFEGLRMRAVADRCGINVATLDYHAGGKTGLIALVASSLVEDFKSTHLQTDRSGMTAIDELAQELRDFRAVRSEYPDIHPIMATLSRRAPNDPEIARHILPMKAHWHDRIAGILSKGIADGTLRPDLDPSASALIFIWSLISLGSPEQYSLDFPEHATEILKLFAAGPVGSVTGQFP